MAVPDEEWVAPGVVAAPVGFGEVACWDGDLDALGLLLWLLVGSPGSGVPGSSLRGASPGPGTTTRLESRTAPPSSEPMSRVRPMETAVTRAPRRST